MNARRARVGGFTLLELLASMAIFLLIAGAAYAALHSAGRIWEAVDARSAADGEVRLAVAYLRRQLSRASALAVRGEGRWQAWFEGDRSRVTFLVEGSRHVGLGGVYQLTVRHDRDSRPPRMDLVLQPVDERFRAGNHGRRAVHRMLLEDVADMEFTYFGRRDADLEPGWHSRWRDMQRLPRLVRLRLRIGTIGDWPAMTVRLPVDGLRFHHVGARDREPDPGPDLANRRSTR